MAKKRTQKAQDVPDIKWKKHRGSFTYELVDPVTGGLWIYYAKRKMAEAELFSRILFLMRFCNVERPKRGQVSMLNPVAEV